MFYPLYEILSAIRHTLYAIQASVLYRLSSIVYCLSSVLYTCSERTTNQPFFMQNEPNFRKSQMNVNKVLTKDYDKRTLGERGKNEPKTNPNEPKTNPNEPKSKKAKMNVTSILTVGYENKPHIRPTKKQSQISKRQKPMQPSLTQRIMKKTALLGPAKTNPIKPNL